MRPVSYRLESTWQPDGGPNGRVTFTFSICRIYPLSSFQLAYTSLTRVVDAKACANATFVRRDANFHEFAPPGGRIVAPGASWTFTVGGLHRRASHCTDGAKSAYLRLADGRHVPAGVSDLLLEGRVSAPPPVLLPEGKLDLPFALQPAYRTAPPIDVRAGSVCLNSLRRFAKRISAVVMLRPSLASAR